MMAKITKNKMIMSIKMSWKKIKVKKFKKMLIKMSQKMEKVNKSYQIKLKLLNEKKDT